MNFVLILMLALLARSEGDSHESNSIKITSIEQKQGKLYTVKASFVHLGEFLEAVTQATGIKFEGVNSSLANSIVNVSMSNRRIEEVLKYTLGSVESYFTKGDDYFEIHSVPSAETEEGREWLKDQGIQESYTTQIQYPGFQDASSLFLMIAILDEKSGKLDTANERYRAILQYYPNSPEVPESLLRLGRNHIQKGEYEKAYGHLSNLVGNYPKFEALDEGYCLIGRALLQTERLERAEQYFELLLSQYPESPFTNTGFTFLAEVQRKRGKIEEAAKSIELIQNEAMLDNTLRYDFLLVHGAVLFDQGDYRKSAPCFARVFAEASTHPQAKQALLRAAEASYLGKDYSASVFLAETYKQKFGSESEDWRKLAAELRATLGLNGFLEADDTAETLFLTAEGLKTKGKLDAAIELLERNFKDSEFGHRSKLTSARYLYEAKQYDRCIEKLQDWISDDTDLQFLSDAFQILGDCYLIQGKDQEAAEAYQGILRRKQ